MKAPVSTTALARRLSTYAETYGEYVKALRNSPCGNSEKTGIAHFEQIFADLAMAAKLLGPRL